MSSANATQDAGGVKASGTKSGSTKMNTTTKPSSSRPGKTSGKKQGAFDLSSLFNGKGIKTAIKEVTGRHDLYFVFKNDKVKPDEPLLSFSNIKFLDIKTK